MRPSVHRFLRDPALPFVEYRPARDSGACYHPHSHPALSVGLVDGGASELTLENLPPQALGAGDVVVIPPGRVHRCNPRPGSGWSYRMLYLRDDWFGALAQESPALRADAFPLWRADPALYAAVDVMLRASLSEAEPDAREQQLLALLSLLAQEQGLPQREPAPDWLQALCNAIRKDCASPWPLPELARRAGVSRFHLIRQFQRHQGQTPHAYLLDCRINIARQRLRQPVTLAELALELGFSDQSHFQRAFRQRVAATPEQYRSRAD